MTAGELLSRLRDFGRAERMYRDATRIKPSSYEAWNNLGVSLAAQGRMGEAIYDFGKALKLNPFFPPAQKNLDAARAGKNQAFQPPPETQPAPTPAPTPPPAKTPAAKPPPSSPTVGMVDSPRTQAIATP